MGSKKLRVIVPIAILVLAAVGFAAGLQTGTLSAFGWNDLVLLCPIGGACHHDCKRYRHSACCRVPRVRRDRVPVGGARFLRMVVSSAGGFQDPLAMEEKTRKKKRSERGRSGEPFDVGARWAMLRKLLPLRRLLWKT